MPRVSQEAPSAGGTRRGGVPLWVTALTVILVASGFHRERCHPSPYRSGPPTAEPGRGRQATGPSEIPMRGWKDIVLRIYGNISRHRIMPIAAGVTYFSLLAIFPGLAALVSVFGLIADPATITAQVETLSGMIPQGAMDVIEEQLTRVAGSATSTLGLTFAGSLLASLWAANAGVKALFDALNVVYDEKEKRSFIRLNAVTFGWTCCAILFLLLAIAAVVVVPIALHYVGLGSMATLLIDVLRWPLLLLGVGVALSFVYRFGPSRENPQWHWVTWGSAFAAVAWLLASFLFSWYADNFGSYNKTYGSLGAVIGFMVWIWLSTIVVLIGAELDAEMEHQTARDTTTGPAMPLGTRGAKMADTVGAAHP